jgi:hypothetical protein
MKAYLSDTPVWLNATASTQALDGKSIVIVEGQYRTSAHIRVSDAEPQSQHSGLCHVKVWKASIDPMNVKWTDPGSPLPTARAHQWEMYLTEDALPLIHQNEENPAYGDLLLEVPEKTKPAFD